MGEPATGVITNGLGKRTTAHLNLTVTLADADKRDTKARAAQERKVRSRRPRESHSVKIPYAGSETVTNQYRGAV
jgi:hypothetical protein